jgi:hypothetical protein
MLLFMEYLPVGSALDADGLLFFLKLLSESESFDSTDGGGIFFPSFEDCMFGRGSVWLSSSGLCGRLDIAPPAAAAGRADPLDDGLWFDLNADLDAMNSD